MNRQRYVEELSALEGAKVHFEAGRIRWKAEYEASKSLTADHICCAYAAMEGTISRRIANMPKPTAEDEE